MEVIDLCLYSKCHFFTGVFKNFVSSNERPGLTIDGTFNHSQNI